MESDPEKAGENNVSLHSNPESLSKLKHHVGFNYTVYIFSSLASFMYGTKQMIIATVECNPMWMFFIEHMAIWMTSVFLIFCYFQYVKWTHKPSADLNDSNASLKHTLEIFKNHKQLIWAIIAGVLNASGNITIIFSMKYAFMSGSSPSTISAIIMFNVIALLIIGTTLFHERHLPMKYFGGALVFVSLMIITTQRSFESSSKYSDSQNKNFYLALLFITITTILWTSVAWACKYAVYYHSAHSVEFGIVAMTLSGLVGSTMIIYLVISETGIEVPSHSSVAKTIGFWIVLGMFTALACFSWFKSISWGSVEVAQLITNTAVFVQAIEEILFYRMFPSIAAWVGIAGVFCGIAIMVFTKEKKNLYYDPNMLIEMKSETSDQ